MRSKLTFRSVKGKRRKIESQIINSESPIEFIIAVCSIEVA